MRRRPNPLLTLLALAVLAWAQVFGMVRGYICDCGNLAKITAFDHCHGPHGMACHDHETADLQHEHEESPGRNDTHRHELLKEVVQARQQAQEPLNFSPPFAWIQAEWTALIPVLTLESKTLRSLHVPDDGGGGSRLWPQVLTHTIALRV